MKVTENDKKAYERMAAGVITAQGFLGKDTRDVPEIIQADSDEMARLGLTFEKAAEELARLKAEGAKGLGEQVTIDGNLLVKSGDARGVLPCPWDDGVFHKTSIEAENTKTGAKVIYSDLSIHLLGVHHFCQGRGSDFRLDPQTLKSLLG